jgi:hypothetical protein
MLLMLGEPQDLRALGGVLRQFARDGGDTRLEAQAFCAARGTRVMLTADAGPPGLHAVPNATDAFVWRLDADQAAAFAAQVDDLAATSRKAGSELLACTQEEEIPVKVSRGEYTDDFLRN